ALAVGVARRQAQQPLEGEAVVILDLAGRPRQVGAGGEQVEVAVPLRVGLGQFPLQLAGQRQVLVEAGGGVWPRAGPGPGAGSPFAGWPAFSRACSSVRKRRSSTALASSMARGSRARARSMWPSVRRVRRRL